MKCFLNLILLFLLLIPPGFAQDYRYQNNPYSRNQARDIDAGSYRRQIGRDQISIPSGYAPSTIQRDPSYSTNRLHDPIYQGPFRLLGSAQVDRQLMKVADAARDASFILGQLAETMSSCLSFGPEQEQRLQEDYSVLDSNPSGQAVSTKFRQAESLIRQAKAEFEAYGQNRYKPHDANDPHIKAGGKLLEQAQEILNGTSSITRKLWDAAVGAAGAAQQLASLIQQLTPPGQQSGQMPPLAPPIYRVVQGNVIPPGNTKSNTGTNQFNPSPGTTNSGNNSPPSNTIPDQSDSPGTFSKPIDTSPNRPMVDNQLKAFAESLRKRAVEGVTEPAQRDKVAKDLSDKFEGIGEGLNEAKEEVKQGATSAFNAAVQQTEAFKSDPVGTLKATAEAAEAFGATFANATESALNAAAQDSGAFNKLLTAAATKAVEASENYSSLSQKEQGKVLGKILFWSANPTGSTQAGQLTAKAFTRAGKVIKPHVGQLSSELKMIAAAGKQKLASGKAKLAQLASNIGNSQRPALATLGPPISRGPPGGSAIDDLYNLMVKGEGTESGGLQGAGRSGNVTSSSIKAGTKIGSVVADDLPINEGWLLDGQKLSEGIKWPARWRKPRSGDFLTSKGKLYFRPNEEARKAFNLKEDVLIPMEKGVPDMKSISHDGINYEFKGHLPGNQRLDIDRFQADLAKKNWKGLNTKSAVKAEFQKENITAHHFGKAPNGNHIFQLVDRERHTAFGHTGYAAKLRTP